MTRSGHGVGAAALVSPELVLVDPELRAHLAAEPARAPSWVVAPSPATDGVLAPPRSTAASSSARASAPRRPTRRAAARLVAFVAGACIGVAFSLAAAGARPTFLGAWMIHSSAAALTVSRPAAHSSLETSWCSVESGAEGQQLAWAAVPDATSYLVAIYKRGVRVCGGETSATTLGLETGSGIAARTTLAPGGYEWYVWPISGGRWGASPAVRSRLLIAER
jgi:hypothetical protein